MPTASTGSRATPPRCLSAQSITIRAMPMTMPALTMVHCSWCVKMPVAIAVISVACGADSACAASMPGRGNAPGKPYALYSSSSTGEITTAPATQPISRATCWRHGVAPTSQPVFRSCRLSLEMVATASTAVVVKIASAMPSLPASGEPGRPRSAPTASSRSDTSVMAMMPTPEIGLVDEPTSPAM